MLIFKFREREILSINVTNKVEVTNIFCYNNYLIERESSFLIISVCNKNKHILM